MLLIATIIAVTGIGMTPSSLGAATLNVPKTAWPVCSSSIVTYCVTSVTLSSNGGPAQPLTWVPSGTAPASSSGTATTTSTPTPTTTSAGGSPVSVEGSTVLLGYWSDAAWASGPDEVLGYAGLYVDAEAANAFSNDMFFDVEPVIVDPASSVAYQADQSGTNYPTSLNASDVVTVSLETGAADTGVSMAIGDNMLISPGTDANGTTLTFTGNAVPVGIASDTSQCVDETGIAAADANQLEVFVAVTNDSFSGFGVDGVSGKMFVESNGVCTLSTPVWNTTSQSLSWNVAAPHFLADGSTVDVGFYQAIIPDADAALLWGLTTPSDAVTALEVSVTSSGGSNSVAAGSISVKGGNIIVSSTGFHFSRPKFTVKRNPRYKGSAFAKKKTTIVCVKGKVLRRVRAYSPRCPKGFKRR